MRPGMPPGRKHFRRSRDAPSLPIHAKPGVNGGPLRNKGNLEPVQVVKELITSLTEGQYESKYLMIRGPGWIRELPEMPKVPKIARSHVRHRA